MPTEAIEKRPRDNMLFQDDGWRCGYWVIKWIETKLRRIRGEPGTPDLTLDDGVKRLTRFIMKLKQSGLKLSEQAIAETMDDVRVKVKERQEKGKVRKTVVFPEHQTLEETLAAGMRCTRCVATKLCTKGCKACMGKWFEEIRLRKAAQLPGLPEQRPRHDLTIKLATADRSRGERNTNNKEDGIQ